MSDRRRAQSGLVHKFVAPKVEPFPTEAKRFLEVWGLRTTGSTLKSVGPKRASGGRPGVDEAGYIARYVTETEGFERAKPVLLHVYGHGRPLDEFFYRGPGEVLSHALAKHGWFCWIGKREGEIPGLVLNEFFAALTYRLEHEPFTLPDETELGAAVDLEDALAEDEPETPEESLRVRYYGKPR